MSWRTVVISSRSKLDFKMNYMIIRKDFETTKVYIDEIYMLVIESTAVSLTAILLNELIKKKVAIVFCDEKGGWSTQHSPGCRTGRPGSARWGEPGCGRAGAGAGMHRLRLRVPHPG